MIREVGESLGRAVLDGIGRAASRVQERKPLPADLLESDDAYLAVFDAPGASAGDVQVHFEADVLEVSIDRFRTFHEGYEMRFPGRGLELRGEATLPEGVEVDADRAEATLKSNGTLEVLVPKTDSAAADDTEEPPGSEPAADTGTDTEPESA